MMKVAIDKARVYVTARFKVEGSVLAQTVRASLDDVQTRLEVESKDTPDRVAGVVRNAENGCFVMQALLNPVPCSVRSLCLPPSRSTAVDSTCGPIRRRRRQAPADLWRAG
jgi:hypothetical protein